MTQTHTSYWLIFLTASSLLFSCKKEEKPQQAAKPKPITQVVGVARIEPERGLIDIFAGADGRVMTLAVTENQTLTKGQVLLTINSATDKAQIAVARSKIGTQRAAIAAQEATIATLKLAIDQAQTDVELNRKLLAVKGIVEQTLRDSEATLAKRQQEYRKGLADLQQSRAVVTELNADVNSAVVTATDKTLHAPYTGKLLDWTVKIGDFVTGNTQVGQMAPGGPLIARTEVDELFAERIKPGQRARIRSQATGQIIGSGTVYFAADFLMKKSLFEDETAQEDRRVREVRIRLNPNANVLINSRVDCIVLLN